MYDSDADELSHLVCQSPEGSDSGSSMSGNADNLTPSGTPPQAGSPGPAAGFKRLSIHNSGSNTRAQAPRGRVSTTANHSASKRAASTELPRRENPAFPVQNAALRKHHAPHFPSGPSRHKARYEAKQSGSRNKLSNQRDSEPRDEDAQRRSHLDREYVQHGDARSSFDAHRHATTARKPIARDSGYETMRSRQTTLQTVLPTTHDQHTPNASGPVISDAAPDHLTEIVEEPKGVVTRLAGPVPVLIDSRYPKLIMQPESSPISQDQLAAEVKGIYGGLVMVEAKCK